MNARVERIRKYITDHGFDALLIRSRIMKRYLGTLAGSGCTALITHQGGYLLMDGRYLNEANELEPDLEHRVHAQGESYLHDLAPILTRIGARSIAVEASEVRVSEYEGIKGLGVTVTLLDDELKTMRLHKDADEIAAVRHAVDVADRVYASVLDHLHVGMSEFEISALVQYYAIAAGAESMSFETIVASGERSALPHGRPTSRRVAEHEPILIDFGAQVNGYQSDMTRVCFLGEPSEEIERMYETVLAANLSGIDAIRVGAVARDVDAAARDVITSAGYGEYFTHGVGHGIGMGGDLPVLNPTSRTVLDDRMIMSCEPGIYVPGVGGIRIEDDVLLQEGRALPLNRTSKQLRVLDGR